MSLHRKLRRMAAGSSVPLEVAYTGGAVAGGTSSPITYASIPFGDASPTRRLAAIIMTHDAGERLPTAVTIGGISASEAVSASDASYDCLAMWIADVPTGTSGDIVATYSGAVSNSHAFIVRLDGGIGGTYSTSTAPGNSPHDLSLNIPSGDSALIVGSIANDYPTITMTTGATEDFNGLLSGISSIEGMVATELLSSAETPRTVTVTITGSVYEASCAACFQ